MHLILIGFASAGKSTVGKEVATELRLPFVDTDHLVGDPQKLSREGTLRAKEAEVLTQLPLKPSCVIATGGGTVLAPINLCALGWIVYLQASLATLEKRVDPKRPFLQGMSLASVAKERFPLYEALAEVTIAIDAMTTKEIASMICEQWATRLALSSAS